MVHVHVKQIMVIIIVTSLNWIISLKGSTKTILHEISISMMYNVDCEI